MAVKRICDICGEEAVASMEFKTDQTTPLIKDLCISHLERIKKVMNGFINGEEKDSTVA